MEAASIFLFQLLSWLTLFIINMVLFYFHLNYRN